jgi:hypothetical protein
MPRRPNYLLSAAYKQEQTGGGTLFLILGAFLSVS